MKITLAKSAGFCFGVKRAIEIAHKTAKNNRNVVMLGDIVHNEDVVMQIKRIGIKKIKALSAGKNKTLLIRAHGAPAKTYKKALKSGYKIIDATCPMVKEIHRIVKNMEKEGRNIIIVGDKKHSEVQGIIGQLKRKAIIIYSLQKIPLNKIKRIKKACVVAQSTQNLTKTLEIVKILKDYINDLRFFNTICKPTQIKQEEIKLLPKENNAMIIIGSKHSANTKRLYEISKSLNRKTYWITSKREIKPEWFKKVKTVGITAGASTPDKTTQDVIKHMGLISSVN